jgi:hypothetical protein
LPRRGPLYAKQARLRPHVSGGVGGVRRAVAWRAPRSADARGAHTALLRKLGYEQELRRGLAAFDNAAIGFATISPVVALYGVVLVGMVVAGPAWVWVLPVALAGQCVFLAVYAELASESRSPTGRISGAGGWWGPTYAWFNGWVALCAYAVANATIAYTRCGRQRWYSR